MTKEKIQNIIDGKDTDIPTLCVIKDFEHLVTGDESDATFKVIESLRDSGVTRVEASMARDLIDALGLVPSLTVRGQGIVFDTPDKAFRKKYRHEKVYITT